MSKRLAQKKCPNLDILTKGLIEVDEADYNHPIMALVMKGIYCLDEQKRELVIRTALNLDWSFDELMEHIRSLFMILKHKDDRGKYCGLGFGKECISVATWDSWNNPEHANKVIVTKTCRKGKNGELICGHLLDFAELWMKVNNSTFEDFLSGISKNLVLGS